MPAMLDLITGMRLVDIVDILLVAFIIYRILLLIRGTRAVQIITGLALLFFVFLLSKRFGLLTFQWLVGNFLAYIIVIMVILFQNEIRSGLAKMGRYRFLRHGADKSAEVLDELVSAIMELSERKRGAIIVLEREVGLKDVAEKGSPVDARFSKDMLLSITHPESPLHDGAIIISGDRIIAAGVILPISQEVMMLPIKGARHRAALSVTYESDAVSIVVSEENGEITLFLERSERKVSTREELELILNRLFGRGAIAREKGKLESEEEEEKKPEDTSVTVEDGTS